MVPKVELSDEQLDYLKRLRDDLPFFSRHCLKIKTKRGKGLEEFVFTSAQLYIHNRIEEQLKRTGKVRIIIVKGRQQGCSTYVEARFYWKCIFGSGFNVCILSHEKKSTANLFDKVDTYDRYCPDAIKPKRVSTSFGNTLKFTNECEYMVVTAGSDGSGRGNTALLQHQSERGFFGNPESVDSGVGQVVSSYDDTEVIKESTGNGKNFFYSEVLDALSGLGEYEAIFVPWYWQPEYVAKVPDKFVPTSDELALAARYKLTDEQLMWRRNKIVELKSERLFKQEYPNYLIEAFQSGENSFFDPNLVEKARSIRVIPDKQQPLVLGVDPGRKGDRTIIVMRRGREIIKIWKYDTKKEEMDTQRLTGILADIIDEYEIDKVFIDYGMGYGVVDNLRDLGYRKIVQGVHFGEKPSDVQYLNKRAEMAFTFRDWLSDGDVSLPDDDDMAADIDCLPDFKFTATRRMYFPDKAEIKKKYGRSPDILDAIMLTFAYVVRSRVNKDERPQKTANTRKGSQMSTLSRVRTGNRQDAPHRRRVGRAA